MRTAAILGIGVVVGSTVGLVAGSYFTAIGLYRVMGDELPKVLGHRIADGVINQRDKALQRYLGAKPRPDYVYSCKHDPSR